jgi:glycopeptide antibiotics resistance protein
MSERRISAWIFNPPSDNHIWIILPLSFTFFLQFLTGLPRPDLLEELDASRLLIEFSEGVFSYPFWLQDLSHLPLFALLTWLWFWFFKSPRTILISPAFHISWVYACLNEVSQFLVPNRFPSMGDLVMNLLGVTLSTLLYFYLISKILNHRVEK